MPFFFTRSLPGKTLLRLAAGGALVVLAASVMGTFVLYRQSQRQALDQLSQQVGERAHVADRVLTYVAETHEAVSQAFVEAWPHYQSSTAAARFDSIMRRYPDGIWRNREALADGTKYPSGWIRGNTTLTEDLKRRVVLFYDLSAKYGPGTALRYDNLFFVSLPEEANVGYDPNLYPDWPFELDVNFSQLDYEWGRTAYAPARPGEPTRWSTPVTEVEVPTVGAVYTALTPIVANGRHLATVGTTLRLSDFLDRVLPPDKRNERYLIFHPDGRLIADTRMVPGIEKKIGVFRMEELEEKFSPMLLATAKRSSPSHPQIAYDAAADIYFSVTQMERSGWHIAVALPGASVRSAAINVASMAVVGGFATLLSLLALHAFVLKKQVAGPLEELTSAVERVAGGAEVVVLPLRREDELGRLASAVNDMAAQVTARDAALRRDKQEIEHALTALRLTEERWRGMTDNASDTIAIVSTTGVFTYASPPIERILGYSPAALVDTVAMDLVHADDVARLGNAMRQATGDPIQFRGRHANGGWISLEAVASDQRHHPAVNGIVLNIRDVSKIAEAEKQLEKQRQALHQSERFAAMGSMLAGVAHELNNPLSIVMGRASLLRDTTKDPKDQVTAQKIYAAAQRCAGIVKTFLITARQQEISRVPTDINDAVLVSLDGLLESLGANKITVETRLAQDLPAVSGDPDKVCQILVNLITNAVYALSTSDGDSRISISTALGEDGRWVHVDVSDSGPGVPAELGGRVFDPFFSTKPVGVGTGLGLSVSAGIAEALGGTLTLLSTNQGAAFRLILPVSTEDKAPLGPEEKAQAERPMSVLVVDDETEVADLLAELLQRSGHSVMVVHDGHAALDCLSTHPFDAIFTDLKMPGLDGIGLYEAIRQGPFWELSDRVVVVTGDALSPRAMEFFKDTDVPLIDKPFALQEVLRALGTIAARQQRIPAQPNDRI